MFDGGTGLPAGLPPPLDDGAAAHLPGKMVPDLPLPSTSGTSVCLARLQGRTVLYVYPLTGRPGKELPPGWDLIPGARGCTPQSCGFRDLHAELRAAGADHVLGLSTQSPEYQLEMAERLHLPFPVLSDDALVLGRGLGLPTFEIRVPTLCSSGSSNHEAIQNHETVRQPGKIPTVQELLLPQQENQFAWMTIYEMAFKREHRP